jgi:uncharacterized protein (DUF433 family)
MANSSTSLYLQRKKLVINDIDYIIDSKSKQEYVKRQKNIIFRIFNSLFGTGKNKRQTFSQRKTPADFLLAIENSNMEIEEIDEHIETILVSANRDKNILEECENYLTQKYKVHLARMQSITSVLQLIVFIATILILVFILGYFPIIDVKISDTNNLKTIGFLASVIAVVTTSGAVTNILMPIFKSFVEDNHATSTSVYEYCLELLKNAKIRAGIVKSVPPSLDRITINPNKMNGQPCIRDLRLTVWRVLELLQTYPDRSELYREFPELTEEDIKQAIIYADVNTKELAEASVVTNSIAHETFA